MQQLNKLIMTLVALFAMTTGAWAQSADPTVTWDATTKQATFTMPAGNVELQVAYFPGMLTLGPKADDNKGGIVELVEGSAPVEWTPETWTNVSTTGQHGDLTSGDITLTATGGWLTKQSNGNLSIYASYQDNNQTFTISTEGDGFTRIEMTMEEDYWQGETHGNPHILPLDGWTFDGKNAVWEGEATKKLVCQSCTTKVAKIVFYRGAAQADNIETDTDGNIYVKSGTKFKVKATPNEGYHLTGWSDDETIKDLEREITMGDADLTLTATFSDEFELTFDDVNFKTNQNITVKVGDADKTLDQDGKLSVKAGQTVTLTAKQGYKFRSVEAKKAGAAGPVTYTELKGGEVLHVGDKIQVPESDKYWYPGAEALDYKYTYEVVRVNISGDEFEPTVTESETGAYYALHVVGTNNYRFVTVLDSDRLKVTATSDGIAVADNGTTSTGYHKYIFSVHEPSN